MTSLERIQNDILSNIQKSYINYKKSPKERINLSYVEARLDTLEEQWNNFSCNHNKIVSEVSDNEFQKSNYNLTNMYEKGMEKYIEYKSELKSYLLKNKDHVSSEFHCKENSKQSTSNNIVKLPKIEIPTFSGKYTEWTSFRDLFISLIHNNKSLDGVQKLHYLKGHLTGEAEQLLRHQPITESNYDVCWKQLDERYNNKRYLCNCILKRLMNQRPLTTESSSAIKELLDTTNECLYGLQNIGVSISSWDVLIIYIISLKLDSESRRQWEQKSSETFDELPTIKQFREFMEHRFRSLEFLDSKIVKQTPKTNFNVKTHHVTTVVCVYCNEGHKLCFCKGFVKESLEKRREFVQSNGLCFNCLGPNHSAYTCRVSTRCRVCKRKHHSLLHPKNVKSTEPEDACESAAQSSSQDEHLVTCFSNVHSQVLLATAMVTAESKSGNRCALRSLLDQGSQASFITESAVQLLGLKKVPNMSLISGLGSDQGASIASKYMVRIKIQSRLDSNFVVIVNAHVLKKLTTILPKTKLIQLWSSVSDVKLADPAYHIPSKIDLLLGADVYGQILIEGLIKGPPGYPVAQNTKFGWILSGQIGVSSNADSVVCHNIISTSNDNELLKRFWEIESDEHSLSRHLTPEEQRCEEIYMNTTKRDDSGRYIVRLPFRHTNPMTRFGNSCDIAVRRFNLLERKLSKSPTLKQQYSEVMQEYIRLGHMELVPPEQRNATGAVYLPHHAVIREDKITTKVRVVFDASCLDSSGVSLNSELMVGPTIQSDLRHIIMRWRLHPICLVADIVKMYRQIKVTQEDADFQRIIWRDEAGKIQHYKMVRVTFGTASAPYVAVRTLQQLARDENESFPKAAKVVLRDFYVDDMMTGCQTVAEGLDLFTDLTKLMSSGCFELQKWMSNDEQLLKKIDDKMKEPKDKLELKMDEIMKVLGLAWNRRKDEFEYSVNLPPLSAPITKRKVISDISRLFDPLGWLAPAIIIAKIFIQKIWVTGIEWDQELPPQLLSDWLEYRADLSNLTNYRVPRWMHTRTSDTTRELHGFSDASKDAYAAVVYIRIIGCNGQVHVNLVTSKTKVAPIKQVSIPRLEVCGAVLLAKLLRKVAEILEIPKDCVRAWIDSSVVLAWLSSHPSKWKTFIANRVSDILTITDRDQWSHVRSNDNPADHASRGIKPSEMASLTLWNSGPSWLQFNPINYGSREVRSTDLEQKSTKMYHAATFTDCNIFDKYFSLSKLLRIIGWCLRYTSLTRVKIRPSFPAWLTTEELEKALILCIRNCQNHYFLEDNLPTTQWLLGKIVAKHPGLDNLTRLFYP